MAVVALTQKSTRQMLQSSWLDQTLSTRTVQLGLMSRPTLVSSLHSSVPAGGQELLQDMLCRCAEEGWAFNLFNNAWATNFPAFSIDKDQRFRFDVRLR